MDQGHGPNRSGGPGAEPRHDSLWRAVFRRFSDRNLLSASADTELLIAAREERYAVDGNQIGVVRI